MTEIFLDTETTGLSVKDGDRVLEIACIETENLIPTNRIFHKLINPQVEVSPEALKVHGYSNDFLKDKKKFEDIVEDFLEFIKNRKLIIHNAPFDIGFLNNELIKTKNKILNIKNVEDTLSFARSKFPSSSNSLDSLCKRFNIDNSKREKHNALLDCELLRQVYINLVGEKEPSLAFNINNTHQEKKVTFLNNKENKEKIYVNPSVEELNKHTDFLKKELKKNFF